MAIPVTSIGLIIAVANETTPGERPTSGYTRLPKVYEFPELNLEPDTIDTTSYDNEKYKTATTGLIDTTGIMTMNAFYSKELETIWNDVCTKFDANVSEGACAWLMIDIPKISEDAFYIPIEPVDLALPSFPLNDAVRQSVSFTLAGDIVKAAKVADREELRKARASMIRELRSAA